MALSRTSAESSATSNTTNTDIALSRTNENSDITTWFTSKHEVDEILRTMCHTEEQQVAWALPADDIDAKARTIKESQLKTGRPSYINAFLIQSRGSDCTTPCSACQKSGGHPFVRCKRLQGFWNGSCANCKWKDHSKNCSVVVMGEARTTAPQQIEGPERVIELDDDEEE